MGTPALHVTALVARWRAATSTLTWVSCGQPAASVVGDDGDLRELEEPSHPPLGSGAAGAAHRATERRMARASGSSSSATA
jgi:hypothetical protein